MKLIKTMLTGMVILAFAMGQDQTQGGPPPGPPPCDPNATYPVADPGPDGGCANYNDCNGNGAYDAGEPCGDMPQGPPPFESVDANGDGVIDREEARAVFGYDDEGNEDPEFDAGYDDVDSNGDGVVDPAEFDAAAAEDQGPPPGTEGGGFYCGECDVEFGSEEEMHQHMEEHHGGGDGGPDPVWEAFASTLENGGSPDDAFEAAAAAVYDLEVASGNMSEEEFQEGKDNARAAFDQALADGKSPEEAFGDAAAANQPPAPTNHWDGNCAAMCEGHGEYWLDSDGDGQPEDGPYATWDHDADGNPVDCGCGDGDGDDHHPEGDYDGDGHDPEGDMDGGTDGPDGGPGGPPPFEAIDANSDGLVNMDEARAFFSNDPEFNEDEFANDFARVDANGDGSVDEGEHVDEVARQIAGGVFGETMANGGSPEDAFNNVAGALHEFLVGGGHESQEGFDNARDAAWNAFQEALQNGASPEEAFGAAMQAGGEANNDDGGN